MERFMLVKKLLFYVFFIFSGVVFGYIIAYDQKLRAEKNYINSVNYLNYYTVLSAKLHVNTLLAIEEGKYDLAKEMLIVTLKSELDSEFNEKILMEEKLLEKAFSYQDKYCIDQCLTGE